jgi:hypothetical protein
MKLVEYINSKGKTVEHYPKLYGKQRKQEKRDEAEQRQVERDKLTLEQKIAKAVPESKEHIRLTKQLG